MILIDLTSKDDEVVVVNPHWITHIDIYKEYTSIGFITGNKYSQFYVIVKETPIRIKELIEKEENKRKI